MSEPLEYQECYHKPAHSSVINVIVLSHDGRRLITGGDDSTVLVWSTQNGSILCRIKTRSPVLSLAWVENSSGFLLGCEDGRLASVDLSPVCTPVDRSHFCVNVSRPMLKRLFSRVTTLRSLVFHRSLMTSFRYLQPVRTSKFGCEKDFRRLNSRVRSYTATIVAHSNLYNAVENWELKVKLVAPGLLHHRHQEVEVTSVNWESRDAAASASHVLVSYRWHGIMYVIKFSR
jgi:WD40 repeat protein